MKEEKLSKLERISRLPMFVLSLIFLALFIVSFKPPQEYKSFIEFSLNAIWVIFAIEFFSRLGLSKDKIKFIKENWIDALVVLFPALRPLRILRVLFLLPTLIRPFVVVRRIMVMNGFIYALAITLTLLIGGAYTVFLFEREAPQGNIKDFSTALWWAFITVTTIGYGDVYPVTLLGKIVTGILVFLGITLFGMLTANLASFFFMNIHKEVTLHDIQSKLTNLESKLDDLEKLLRESHK